MEVFGHLINIKSLSWCKPESAGLLLYCVVREGQILACL